MPTKPWTGPDCIVAIATVMIFLTTAIYTYYARRQWQEMKTSGSDTHALASSAIASSRAWIVPEHIMLTSRLESGLPVTYQIRISNPGKEPALSVVWNIKPVGVPYIPEGIGSDNVKLDPNTTCIGLEPKPANGIVLYPAAQTSYWVPMRIPDTAENRQLVAEVLKKTESLVIEGCFAYTTTGGKHTSSFRFFLRDTPNTPSLIFDKDGKIIHAWNFNAALTGNDAN
ncbi:MAG: hypothetical protein ABSC60_06725 [Acidobacteriota bacterium]